MPPLGLLCWCHQEHTPPYVRLLMCWASSELIEAAEVSPWEETQPVGTPPPVSCRLLELVLLLLLLGMRGREGRREKAGRSGRYGNRRQPALCPHRACEGTKGCSLGQRRRERASTIGVVGGDGIPRFPCPALGEIFHSWHLSPGASTRLALQRERFGGALKFAPQRQWQGMGLHCLFLFRHVLCMCTHAQTQISRVGLFQALQFHQW